MKILLILHEHLNPDSGSAGSVFYLGHYYEKLGHQVYYYSFDDLPKNIPYKLKDVFFPEFVSFKIHKIIKQADIDVIDCSTGDSWFWSIYFKRFFKKNLLLVTRSHGLEHLEHLEVMRGDLPISWKYSLYHGSLQLWEVATSLRQSDLIFLLNRDEALYVTQNLGIPSNRTHVFPNGMPDEFLDLPFEPTPLTNDSTIRIAQVGTFVTRKGIQFGVPALNKILLRFPYVHVSFIGTELNGLGKTEEVYAGFDPSVQDRVTVIPSFEHKTLPSLLKGHQIKLFSTLSEGFGKALIESMACGLAPVTTSTSGPMDIVHDGYDSIVVPLRNSNAIALALERLVTDRLYLDKLRHNAYLTAQKYSWQRIAQERLSTYEQALYSRKTSASECVSFTN